ncbi:MAG: ornithine aminotransferase [Bacteroidetes bacterium GWF2_38_335]|nr:MAG: ornithine aminotransferase [Bacteroidetes bacterium GWF2_38_335]OFY78963.1 MAG: ornithine aminotransferase [Bacteroidetes bacterium RIFOXYA12_FULL_38_20]HBS86034.1 ornithine aminotransferase [Bacteroidales bacterium]
MRTNEELQKDVQEAIKWEPLLNAAEIGVSSKDGVITLTGVVDSFAKKLEAEDAAKNVVGVRAIVEKIEVIPLHGTKTDNDLANDVLQKIKMTWEIPNNEIKIKVEKGVVTLEGELKWNYQKEAAKKAIINIPGVKDVLNFIVITGESFETIEKRNIEQALERNWSINERKIYVTVSGHKVTLSGSVGSLYQKEQAERIAWNAPGILLLDNELTIT